MYTWLSRKWEFEVYLLLWYDHRKKEPFVKGWTADEELRLLEGQDVFRFGNWEYSLQIMIIPREISAYVGSKTEKHCVDHYIKCYLQTDDLLPNSREILSDDFVGMSVY